MKTNLILAIACICFAGCQLPGSRGDLTPPSSPRGIYTETGDNFVELAWLENPEFDVAGYNVFASSSYFGTYVLIGTTAELRFVDLDAENGQTYYYALSAYDFAGNESELSREVIYDTPRPEGYDVAINNYRVQPNFAGYDFSTYSVGPYDDRYTDVFFEYYNGSYFMDVWDDTDIQDMGFTSSLYDITKAPDGGWSPTKDVLLILGHTYTVWTWDDHYAKFRVTSLSPSRVVIDWAYQLQESNTRLKRSVGVERRMRLGKGAQTRAAESAENKN